MLDTVPLTFAAVRRVDSTEYPIETGTPNQRHVGAGARLPPQLGAGGFPFHRNHDADPLAVPTPRRDPCSVVLHLPDAVPEPVARLIRDGACYGFQA